MKFFSVTPKHEEQRLQMKRKRWQSSSNASSSPSFRTWKNPTASKVPSQSGFTSSTSSSFRNFSNIPPDVLNKIAGPFNSRDVISASSVCKSWRDALQPLCEAMVYVKWGKRLKNRTDDDEDNLKRALDCYLKGISLGSIPCMIDAGVIYSKLGKKDKAIALYRRAAELADPIGQFNLGITLLKDDSANPKEAVRWLHKASLAGCARAQYQLAVCLQQGRGVQPNKSEAAEWYKRAAEGGDARAMYNTSLCYFYGQGLPFDKCEARTWMAKAADCGHSRAQYAHGLELYSSGDVFNAAVFVELAVRADETLATDARYVILHKLSANERFHLRMRVKSWKPVCYQENGMYS